MFGIKQQLSGDTIFHGAAMAEGQQEDDVGTDGRGSNARASRRGAMLACGVGTALGPSLLIAAAPLFTAHITGEFGWNRATQSAAILPAVLLAPLSMPLAGRLVDRFGVRSVVIPATLLYAFAIMSYCLQTGHPLQLTFMQMAVGLTGFSATGAAFLKTMATWLPRHRGKAFAFLGAVIGVSSALWAGLAPHLLSTIGWRGAYLALGLTILLISFPIQWLFLHEAPAKAQPATAVGVKRAMDGLTFGEAVRTRTFWLLFGALAIDSFAMRGFQFHSAFYLGDHGIADATTGLLLSAIAGSMIVGQILTGWLLDRRPSQYWAIAFFSCPLAGLLLITHVPLSAGPLVIAGVLLGLGAGAENTLGPFFSIGYFGTRSFTEIQGYKLASLAILTGLGGFAVGAAYVALGSYGPIFTVLELLMGLCIVMVALLPRFIFTVVRPAMP